MVVWAHNGHVGLRSYGGGRLVTMGSHLRRQLKASYVSLGFVFSHGSYQALEPVARPGIHEITLDEPPEHYTSTAFARTGKPLLLLDLRSLPTRGAVHDWFVAPHPLREADSRFYSDVNLAFPNVLPTLYDTVIFVERTTRARPLHPHR
jgi:erythromycin esterase